jgi:hypothetical protein
MVHIKIIPFFETRLPVLSIPAASPGNGVPIFLREKNDESYPQAQNRVFIAERRKKIALTGSEHVKDLPAVREPE